MIRMAQDTEFMLQLHKDLLEKKKVADSTANAYLRGLVVLNKKRPFKNLSFLKDTDHVMGHLKDKADSTQKSVLGMILSILTMYDGKPGYKKVKQFYVEQFSARQEAMKGGAVDTNTKTETQKENWADWEEVKKIHKTLYDKVKADGEKRGKKAVSPEEFDDVLHLAVMSLYTLVQPRRNKDYLEMDVFKQAPKTLVADAPKDRNYIVFDKNEPTQFVFNVYKTAKTYGQQVVEIPPELKEVLGVYFKVRGKAKSVPGSGLLINHDGDRLTAINAITRILNKVFNKKVGSSMLRHSYLSDKYDIGEMKADADAMGHSLELQREYMKVKEPEAHSVVEEVLVCPSGMGHLPAKEHVKEIKKTTRRKKTQPELSQTESVSGGGVSFEATPLAELAVA